MSHFDPDERSRDLTARIGRLAGAITDDDVASFEPPASVWDGIVARLEAEQTRETFQLPRVVSADEADDDSADSQPAPIIRLSERRRNLLLPVAIAASVAALGGVVGSLLPGSPTSSEPTELASAPLASLRPVVPIDEAGEARAVAKLVREADGRTHLELDEAAMPAVPDGYHYELWLVDPSVSDPRSLSDGDMDGRLDFDVPSGIDVAEYPIVDISVEPNDGNPAHAGLDHSILRGRLEL